MSQLLPKALTEGARKRWAIAAIILALLLLGIGGLAFAHFRSGPVVLTSVAGKPSTCSDTYRLVGLRPSEITDAHSVCLVQSLKFTGELAGMVGEAYTVSADAASPASMCAVPKRWDGFPQARLAMVIGSKAYRLRISAPGASAHQTATINDLSNTVELASISDPSTDWSQATGTVTLNPDGITGKIDANLTRDVAGAQPVHISGQWACGAPLPSPASGASAPCANFYALNQLQPADVARMKAKACNTENLTFSGDISARLGHAVNDSAISPQIGYGGDNFCGSGGEEYTATLKFSIGDESFLLDLDARKYPSVGPGRYSAQTTGASSGAVLFLGHADPADHGAFVTDDQVFWLGSGGTFTIARDMKSGSIDANLGGASSHAASSVHIVGSWRCKN
jgi:hypothetical protein